MKGIDKAIKLAGGTQDSLARILGGKVTQSHVSYWKLNGVPSKRAKQIVDKLDNRITFEELCPEFFS